MDCRDGAVIVKRRSDNLGSQRKALVAETGRKPGRGKAQEIDMPGQSDQVAPRVVFFPGQPERMFWPEENIWICMDFLK